MGKELLGMHNLSVYTIGHSWALKATVGRESKTSQFRENIWCSRIQIDFWLKVSISLENVTIFTDFVLIMIER